MTVRSRAMDKAFRQTQKSNLFIWIVKTLLCKEVTKKLLNLREINKTVFWEDQIKLHNNFQPVGILVLVSPFLAFEMNDMLCVLVISQCY